MPTASIDDLQTVQAIREAMRAELHEAAEYSVSTAVLDKANALFHRGLIVDIAAERRVAKRSPLLQAIERCGVHIASDSDDPFQRVEDQAESLLRDAHSDDLRRLVKVLASVDLPDLGAHAPTDVTTRENAVMNSLGEESRSTLSVGQLVDYLSDRFGSSIQVRSARRLSGGFSKTTTLVEVRRNGVDEEIVLRQVAPGRDAHTLVGEYEVVRYVWQRGANVPEPLWIDGRDNALGGPFFASRRALGSNVGDVFGPRPDTDASAGTELARALGRLHAIDVSDLVTTPIPAMADPLQIAAAVNEQHEIVKAVAGENAAPQPLHALLFAWLRANIPTGEMRPVLLHGDPGFHNILLHDGKLTAMLDWERARVGDPAQDLAYVRPHVTRVQPWGDFLAAYQEAGGSVPDEATLRFYSVWHDTWRFTGAYRGLGRLRTNPRTLLDGVLGLLHSPRFLLSGIETAFEVDL